VEREHLLIRGRLDRDDDFTPRRCESTTFIRDRPEPNQPDHGDVVVETLDEDGRVVRTERPSVVREGVCAPADRTWRVRVYIALDEGASTVSLRRGDRVLWSVRIPESPDVRVELASRPTRGDERANQRRRSKRSSGTPGFPGGEPAVLGLEFTRPDEPDIAFVKVVYRWSERGFHVVHIGPAVRRITIDPDRLPGGDRCEFFVAYSNGIRTGLARTDAFELPPIGPVIDIVQPVEGSGVTEGMPIALEATVVDPEHPSAPLDREAVRWWVDGEEAGVGLIGSVDPLPAGSHTVTLEYTGRESEPVRVERSVTVEASRAIPADLWEPVDPFAD